MDPRNVITMDDADSITLHADGARRSTIRSIEIDHSNHSRLML